MKLLILVILLFTLFSCGSLSRKKNLPVPGKSDQQDYVFKDKTASFDMIRTVGFSKDKKNVVVKQSLRKVGEENEDSVLEELSVSGTPGQLKDKTQILRPYRSVYNVWFDKKKYTSEMRLNTKSKKLDVQLTSPEAQWSGTKQYSFPKGGTSVYCFFSQLVECVRATNFFNIARDKDAGQMNFYVIWEGYPYMQEVYAELPQELFTKVSLDYDGKNEKDQYKFTLNLPNQSIFYFLDKNNELLKMFWVSQGISLVRRDKLDEITDSEEEISPE